MHMLQIEEQGNDFDFGTAQELSKELVECNQRVSWKLCTWVTILLPCL